MGALHDGHLNLVNKSLAENDLTVVSIFVNPTQFAPTEDLSRYPRTLPRDLELLSSLAVEAPKPLEGSSEKIVRSPSAVFVPSVEDMYPSSNISEYVQGVKGTFVEVKGFGDLMEGKSRPSFFRGVATVVTKLFNAVQPSNAYFGQKDIQQALLLRRMVQDLLMPYPTPEAVHIIPTSRNIADELALSSRNVYLNEQERPYATTLYKALKQGERAWLEGGGRDEVVRQACAFVQQELEKAAGHGGVELRLDYIEMNDPWTFDVVQDGRRHCGEDDVYILSGALWLGRTRLIDNIILGDSKQILH